MEVVVMVMVEGKLLLLQMAKGRLVAAGRKCICVMILLQPSSTTG